MFATHSQKTSEYIKNKLMRRSLGVGLGATWHLGPSSPKRMTDLICRQDLPNLPFQNLAKFKTCKYCHSWFRDVA